MSWLEHLAPADMARVAIVAPTDCFRRVLVEVADAGIVELEELEPPFHPAADTLARLTSPKDGDDMRLQMDPPDLALLEREGSVGLVRGEAELERRSGAAVAHGGVTAALGWVPASAISPLCERLSHLGGAALALRRPPGDPPTQLAERGLSGAFRPLLDLYTTLPYRDLDVSAMAGVAYVLMFGMMFGDVGHGFLLLLAGLAIRARWPAWTAPLHRAWPFVVGAGVAAGGFGLAYGEAFGPTGLRPLWLAPLDRPEPLLVSAVVLGAFLLGAAYVIGTVNRLRESGGASALVAAQGGGGAALFAGLAVSAGGWELHRRPVIYLGAFLLLAGVGLVATGYLAQSASSPGGVTQAAIETFDAVVRLGSNVVSFARLAAFGLTHAALSGIVWSASSGLWGRGPAGYLLAGVVFVLGNAVSFALEALVAAVQALRLEFYELFSRIFVAQGRPFRPWHVPAARTDVVGLSDPRLEEVA